MAGIGPADQGLPPQIADSFRQKAEDRGLNDPEIDAISKYVVDHFAQWAQCDEDVVVKKGQGSGLARTIEYLHDSKTVVLHFEREGEERFSIVVCSHTFSSGADLADKVAKDKTRAGQEREAYVSSLLVDAKHVRKVVRCGEHGLLLEGMAQDLTTRLETSRSMIELEKMRIAYHIIQGLKELHSAKFSHQNLHAGNCFQSESGVWKIGDLGCAQRLGEIQTAELNLAVASPAAISARVFGFSHICSIEDDLWALALLLYRLRHGRAPEFSTSQAIQGMMAALVERDACYEAMKGLTHEQRRVVFTCRMRSEKEIPPGLQEHAERLKSVWQSLRSHYKKYSEDLHAFYSVFTGSVKVLDQLMLELFALEDSHVGWLESAESRLVPYMIPDQEEQDVKQNRASGDPLTNEGEEGYLVNGATERVKEAIQSEDDRSLLDHIERGCNIVDWIDLVGNGILHQVALLHRGSGRKVSELLGFLCRCGADVNDRNPEGKTAAHLFAEAGDIDALYDLWILGADFGIRDKKKRRANYYAEKAGVRFVDATKLLAVRSDNLKWNQEPYTNWYLNQVPILELLQAKPDIATEMRQRLELMVLMSYFKASLVIVRREPKDTIQRSPLPAGGYHRTNSNWMRYMTQALRNDDEDLVQPISSPLFIDVMRRYFGPKEYFEIDGLAKLSDTFRALSTSYEQEGTAKSVFLDCRKLVENSAPGLLIASILHAANQDLHPDLHSIVFPFIIGRERGLYYLQNICMGSPEGWDVLGVVAAFSGHVPSPEDAIRWFQELPGGLTPLLKKMGIPRARLVTAGHGVPLMFNGFSDLLDRNAFRQFQNLANDLGESAPPFVQVLNTATADVLRALQALPVDQSYSDEGIGDLLQISCLRIQNAMGMACCRWNSFDAFLNEIDVIHHEIQNILYVVSLRHGYEQGTYERDFVERITSGSDPLVPVGIGDLTVSLQPTDMHCINSILSAVERQTSNPSLCVCLGPECYFEAGELVSKTAAYNVTVLQAQSGSDRVPTKASTDRPFDVLMLDFHSNANTRLEFYRTEDVGGRLKALRDQKRLADPCTLVIDMTLELDDSPELRALLRDPEISEMIHSGSLNLVWHRSAQKFDMLGADNYYGGVICCLNKQDKFRAFNERITDKAAQLGGIYYQGLTHLQRALGGRRDEYQRKLRANAELLYGLLNPDGEALSSVGHQKEPIVEVVRMQEGSRLFLTLRPLHQALAEDELPKLACAIAERLAKQGVTVTHRASFGFARTNIIVFAGSKGMRITAGLEGADAIKAIASAIQEALNVFVRPKT